MPKYWVTVIQKGSRAYEADNREHLDAILFEEEFDDFDFDRTEWEAFEIDYDFKEGGND